MDRSERVAEFRNRLVAYMNSVLAGAQADSWDPRARQDGRLGAERTWLAQEYGRLFATINRYGVMRMASPAAGITSHDVIQDAIHDVGDVYYDDVARIAVQQLDTVIGRLQADEEQARPAREAGAIYRLTSPVYWFAQLAAFVGWVWGSTRGRVIAAAGAVALAILTALVSGLAQGLAQSILSHR